jgi:hypothetical protein
MLVLKLIHMLLEMLLSERLPILLLPAQQTAHRPMRSLASLLIWTLHSEIAEIMHGLLESLLPE